MSTDYLRWGILAAGGIAHKFADALNSLPCARLCAIGSRSKEKALAFGAEHGIDPEHCFGSYEELVSCPDIDVIYIASPHSHHALHAHLALDGGKHVFAEKSFTLTPKEALGVFEKAKARGLFSAEAMWTRFLPANVELMRLIDSGELGDIHIATAAFSSHFPDDLPPTHRVIDPKLGGGALMDMGVYSSAWVSMLMHDDDPATLFATGAMYAPTGCDERATVVCKYASGPETVASCGIKTRMDATGYVCCEKGTVTVPDFWNATSFSVHTGDGKTWEFAPGRNEMGFVYEIQSVTADILAGRTESSVMPHRSTLRVQRTLEFARHTLGFYYPVETEER